MEAKIQGNQGSSWPQESYSNRCTPSTVTVIALSALTALVGGVFLLHDLGVLPWKLVPSIGVLPSSVILGSGGVICISMTSFAVASRLSQKSPQAEPISPSKTKQSTEPPKEIIPSLNFSFTVTLPPPVERPHDNLDNEIRVKLEQTPEKRLLDVWNKLEKRNDLSNIKDQTLDALRNFISNADLDALTTFESTYLDFECTYRDKTPDLTRDGSLFVLCIILLPDEKLRELKVHEVLKIFQFSTQERLLCRMIASRIALCEPAPTHTDKSITDPSITFRELWGIPGERITEAPQDMPLFWATPEQIQGIPPQAYGTLTSRLFPTIFSPTSIKIDSYKQARFNNLDIDTLNELLPYLEYHDLNLLEDRHVLHERFNWDAIKEENIFALFQKPRSMQILESRLNQLPLDKLNQLIPVLPSSVLARVDLETYQNSQFEIERCRDFSTLFHAFDDDRISDGCKKAELLLQRNIDVYIEYLDGTLLDVFLSFSQWQNITTETLTKLKKEHVKEFFISAGNFKASETLRILGREKINVIIEHIPGKFLRCIPQELFKDEQLALEKCSGEQLQTAFSYSYMKEEQWTEEEKLEFEASQALVRSIPVSKMQRLIAENRISGAVLALLSNEQLAVMSVNDLPALQLIAAALFVGAQAQDRNGYARAQELTSSLNFETTNAMLPWIPDLRWIHPDHLSRGELQLENVEDSKLQQLFKFREDWTSTEPLTEEEQKAFLTARERMQRIPNISRIASKIGGTCLALLSKEQLPSLDIKTLHERQIQYMFIAAEVIAKTFPNETHLPEFLARHLGVEKFHELVRDQKTCLEYLRHFPEEFFADSSLRWKELPLQVISDIFGLDRDYKKAQENIRRIADPQPLLKHLILQDILYTSNLIVLLSDEQLKVLDFSVLTIKILENLFSEACTFYEGRHPGTDRKGEIFKAIGIGVFNTLAKHCDISGILRHIFEFGTSETFAKSKATMESIEDPKALNQLISQLATTRYDYFAAQLTVLFSDIQLKHLDLSLLKQKGFPSYLFNQACEMHDKYTEAPPGSRNKAISRVWGIDTINQLIQEKLAPTKMLRNLPEEFLKDLNYENTKVGELCQIFRVDLSNRSSESIKKFQETISHIDDAQVLNRLFKAAIDSHATYAAFMLSYLSDDQLKLIDLKYFDNQYIFENMFRVGNSNFPGACEDYDKVMNTQGKATAVIRFLGLDFVNRQLPKLDNNMTARYFLDHLPLEFFENASLKMENLPTYVIKNIFAEETPEALERTKSRLKAVKTINPQTLSKIEDQLKTQAKDYLTNELNV